MMALQDPPLLGPQREGSSLLVERVDPGEEAGIERDPHLVRGELWRVIAVDRLQRLVGRARIEVVENPADPPQQPAAALQSLDRVGEIRRRAGAGDCRDLGPLLRHAALEGGREMFRPDPLERRQLKRGLPGFEERVVGHGAPVIPAKAGIHGGVDPGLRRDDNIGYATIPSRSERAGVNPGNTSVSARSERRRWRASTAASALR